MPARPAKVSGSAPSATPSRAVSASPRVISDGPGVVAEAHRGGHAVRQRDHVLDRAAQLAADHVVVGVRPEVGRRDRRAAPAWPGRSSVHGDHGGGRLLGGDLGGQVGAGDHDHPVRGRPRRSPRSPRSSAWWCPARCPSSGETRVASGVAGARPTRRGCRAASATARRAPPARRRRSPRPASAVAVTRSGSTQRRAGTPGCAGRRGSPRPPARGGPRCVTSRAGVGEDLGERGAPGAGARAPRRGRSSRLRPSLALDAGPGRPLPQRRRRAAADLGEHVPQPQHDRVGHLLQHRRGRARRPAQRLRSTGGPATTRHRDPRPQVEPAGTRVEDPLRRPTSPPGPPARRWPAPAGPRRSCPASATARGSRVVVPSG